MTHHPRPPATGLTTEKWKQLPIVHIPVGAIVPTQGTDPGHVLAKLGEPHTSHTSDPYGHVVVVDGKWLIEDGHHRYAAAVMRGDHFWPARVFVASSS